METIMDELYEQYGQTFLQLEVQKEIEQAHQALIYSLEKPECKLVLRIIDNKDLIAEVRARESFECGFWIAWRLLTQLNSETAHLLCSEICRMPST